jgi:hypothetical protein
MDAQFPSNLGNAFFTLVSKANSLKFELTGITSSIPNHDTPPDILLLLFGVSTSSGELQGIEHGAWSIEQGARIQNSGEKQSNAFKDLNGFNDLNDFNDFNGFNAFNELTNSLIF